MHLVPQPGSEEGERTGGGVGIFEQQSTTVGNRDSAILLRHQNALLSTSHVFASASKGDKKMQQD